MYVNSVLFCRHVSLSVCLSAMLSVLVCPADSMVRQQADSVQVGVTFAHK